MRLDAGSTRMGLTLVCAAAVAGFVAWSWPLATQLSTHTLVREASLNRSDASGAAADWDLIVANDQVLSLWGAVDNARAILRGDWAGLMSQGQCYPMPESTTLGEHMIELGVQASAWWLLTGDPVVAFNLSFLGALVTGAAGMFLFLHRHTASVAAAVVGALAFAFATPRLVDLPYHPAVVGTHWIPWVLWSFDCAMSGRRATAFAWFAATLLMSALVGSYPLLAVALVGATYGLVTIVTRWRRGGMRASALVWCIVAAVPAVAIAATVLLAYVRVQQEWVLMPNSGAKYVVAAADYLPGGLMSVGITSLLGLVALCLLRRGDTRGEKGANERATASDGASAALAASALLAFLVATALPLPGGATWSLYEELATNFPLLDSVRAPGKVGLAVCFALQALGAIGWSRVFALLASRERIALAAGLVVLIALEASPPRWAHGVFDVGATMQLREVAPARVTIDAMTTALGDANDRRAVLDLPTGRMIKAPLALLDAAYHGHATSACYNSLIPPTMRAVQELIARSRSTGGVAELAAAGFGYVIERPPFPSAALSPSSFPPPARLLVFEKEMAIWGLPAVENVHSDVSRLAFEVTGGATRADTFAPEPPYEIDILVTNRSDQTWMAPRPLQPLFADIELVSGDGEESFDSRARGVLPLALAARGNAAIRLVMPEAPEPGPWRATIRVDGVAAPIVLPKFSWSNERE